MHKKLLLVCGGFMSLVTYAQEASLANPRHVELFNTRNFCVVCTFNDAVLSPQTLYGPAHRNANISASYVYGTVMDSLDLTFAFMYAIKGEQFTIKNSKVRMINLTYSDLPYFTFTDNEGELVNFTGSGLNYGNFQLAKLDYPIFDGTSLADSNFAGVQFKQASFLRTRLVNTNFTDAQLENADFTGANTAQTNFTRANLLNAKITEEQLQNSITCDTLLPDGSLSPCVQTVY